MFALGSGRTFQITAGPLLGRLRHCISLDGTHALDAMRVALADDAGLTRQLAVLTVAPASWPGSEVVSMLPLGHILDGHAECDWSAAERAEFAAFCAESDDFARLLGEARAALERLCAETDVAFSCAS